MAMLIEAAAQPGCNLSSLYPIGSQPGAELANALEDRREIELRRIEDEDLLGEHGRIRYTRPTSGGR